MQTERVVSAGPVWQVRAALHDAEDCCSAPGFLRIVLPALCEVPVDGFSELSAHLYCTHSCQHTDLKDYHSTDPGWCQVLGTWEQRVLQTSSWVEVAQHSLLQVVAGLFISQALILSCKDVHSQLNPQASEAEWGSIPSKLEMCHEHPLKKLQATLASPDSCTAVQVSDIKPSLCILNNCKHC